MVQTCGETIDILWKAAFLGIVGFAAYNWMVKEGITQGTGHRAELNISKGE